MDRRAFLWLLAAAVLWGTTGTAQALGGAEGSPLSVGALRMAIGAAGLALLGARRPVIPPGRWLALGALAMAVYQVAFFSAVARTGVALGTVVAIGSGPVFAGALGRLVRGERPGPRWLVATAIAITGVALIGIAPSVTDPVGVGLALMAGAGYAAATLASKYLVEVMPPTSAMAWMFGGAALLLAPLLPGTDLSWVTAPRGLTAALWLGLAATTAAYMAFARGLSTTGVGPAATIALAEPVTATLLGVAVLAERPSTAAWLGMALIGLALGLLVVSRSTLRFRRRS